MLICAVDVAANRDSGPPGLRALRRAYDMLTRPPYLALVSAKAAAFLIIALHLTLAASIQIDLPATGEECFYEQVDEANKIVGSFEVVAGGYLDVDVTVRSLR